MTQIVLDQLPPSQLRVLADVLEQCADIDDGQTHEALTHVIYDLDLPAHLKPTWCEAERCAEAIIEANRTLPAPA